MKLYLYCSSGSLLEYFTINKIVCNDYLTRRNRKVIHSLGLVSDKFLFFSKHRLLAEKRVYGFEKDYMEIPAIIEVSVSEDDAKNIPVLFVDGEGKAAEEYGILADWKEEYNGFFIKGELPFSYVSRILFDNDNAKDDIYRPSKDLYFPEHLYDVVDDTFSEDMDLEIVNAAGKAIDEKYAEADVASIISNRNKVVSIVLNIITETKEWSFGKTYKANFDDISAELLQIADRLDEITEGLYSKTKGEEVQDHVLRALLKSEKAELTTEFFKLLIEALIPLTTDSFSQKEYEAIEDKVLSALKEKYEKDEIKELTKKLKDIKNLVYGSSTIGLEKMLSQMTGSFEVLQALTFFLRSPKSGMKLSDGLSVYKLSPAGRRYAWVLFSALNGIEPIPADKKGAAQLINAAEVKSFECYPDPDMVQNVSSEHKPEESFVPAIEEEVTPEVVREYLMSPECVSKLDMIIESFSNNKVLAKGFKVKNYVLLANPLTGELPKEECLPYTELEKIVKDLQAYLTTAPSTYDKQKFIKDYIEDSRKFRTMYAKAEGFWKKIYSARDKKDDEC